MDSLSQLALGAAVSVAVMGRRTAVRKAAFWGGVLGTLPDLDALIVQSLPAVQHIEAFSRGFFRVDDRQGLLRITDLRMGQESACVFSFGVAQRGSGLHALETPHGGGRPQGAGATSGRLESCSHH